MVARVPNAKIVWSNGYVIMVGDRIVVHTRSTNYEKLTDGQTFTPVKIAEQGQGTWWFFKDEIYYSDEPHDYTAEEMHLLIRAEEKRRQLERAQKIEQAKELLAREENFETLGVSQNRERIPDDVKNFVWRRDEGKCVRCGSRENLEFDHIIPVSKGGSNTARNIQLLCETCNRKKSNKI